MSGRNLLSSPKTKRTTLVSAGLAPSTETNSNSSSNNNRQKGEVDFLHLPEAFIRRSVVVDSHYLMFLYCNVESSIASELKKSISQPRVIETIVFADEKDNMKIREIQLPDPYDNIVLENFVPDSSSLDGSSTRTAHSRAKSGSLNSNSSETRILKKFCIPVSFQVSSLVQKFMKKKNFTEFSIRYDLCIVNPFKSETSTSTSKISQTTDSVIVSILASKIISNLHLLSSTKDYEKLCAKSHQNHQELISINKDFIEDLTMQRTKLDRLDVVESELENMKRKHQIKLDRILKSAKDNEEQMKSQLIAFDKEIFDLKQKETEQLGTITQYQKEIESLCKKMDELGAFYTKELERSKELESQVDKLQIIKSQNQELVSKYEESSKLSQHLQTQIENLQSQLQHVSSELEKEKENTKKLFEQDESKQSDLENQVAKLRVENEGLSKQHESSQAQITELTMKLKEEQKRNLELQKQHSELNEHHQQVMNMTSKFKNNSITSSPSRRPSLNLANLRSPADAIITNSPSESSDSHSPRKSLTARGRLNSYVAQVKEMYEQQSVSQTTPLSSRKQLT